MPAMAPDGTANAGRRLRFCASAPTENVRASIMTSGESTYPPLDVLKPVADGIWIVDSGPMRVLGLPLPIRMTVIRLADGGLILHSPTRFGFELKQDLDRLGRVQHLVAPNSAHWVFVKQWQDHVPGVVTWGAPGLPARAGAPIGRNVRTRAAGPASPGSTYRATNIFAGQRTRARLGSVFS